MIYHYPTMKNQNILRYTKLYIVWVIISLFNFSIVNGAIVNSDTNTRLEVIKTSQGTYELLLDKVFQGTIDPKKIARALRDLEIRSLNFREALEGDKAYFDLGSIVSSTIDIAILYDLFHLDSFQLESFLIKVVPRLALSGYKYYAVNKYLKSLDTASLDTARKQQNLSANVALFTFISPAAGAGYELWNRSNKEKYLLNLMKKNYFVNFKIFKMYLDRLLKYSTSDDTVSGFFPNPKEITSFNLSDVEEDDLHS
jgi:hypothetical protein